MVVLTQYDKPSIQVLLQYFVRLSDSFAISDSDKLQGFICDWENKREVNLYDIKDLVKSSSLSRTISK